MRLSAKRDLDSCSGTAEAVRELRIRALLSPLGDSDSGLSPRAREYVLLALSQLDMAERYLKLAALEPVTS